MAFANIINQQAHASFTIYTTYLAILIPLPFFLLNSIQIIFPHILPSAPPFSKLLMQEVV